MKSSTELLLQYEEYFLKPLKEELYCILNCESSSPCLFQTPPLASCSCRPRCDRNSNRLVWPSVDVTATSVTPRQPTPSSAAGWHPPSSSSCSSFDLPTFNAITGVVASSVYRHRLVVHSISRSRVLYRNTTVFRHFIELCSRQ